MDPADNDVEAPDEALMAQMGFSSFGATSPPSKRRRYNPNADATLPSQASATGANSTALGTPFNNNEISLEDDEEEDDKPRQQVSAQVRPAGLPQRPAPAHAPRQGQHAAPRESKDTWYIGYYDHLSNENPWDRIEKARGLTTRGTWIPRNTGGAVTKDEVPV
ncbi:hypothetical protein FHETE_6733 [Fusarium heterosporum]|uniref:Uncharacterized protein n=1 Tax=Fusarium heterosporum TaxID=42747 RepID=A0A8H5WP95_FUSHE|nr:hypothetical protein FHETE_6733 [Fusarium heterosporum]